MSKENPAQYERIKLANAMCDVLEDQVAELQRALAASKAAHEATNGQQRHWMEEAESESRAYVMATRRLEAKLTASEAAHGETRRELAGIMSQMGDRSRVIDAERLAHAETWRLVNALIEALPTCDGEHENRPATRAWGRGGPRFCDDCGGDRVPEYPRAAPLRALLAARAERKSK